MGKREREAKKAAKAKDPEAAEKAAREAQDQDTGWARQMAGRLLHDKRGAGDALRGRHGAPLSKLSLPELLALADDARDKAMLTAHAHVSMDAYRAALTIIAFQADIGAGGTLRLEAAIEKELPLRLHESNDRERLERERGDRAHRVATEVYRLALVEALAEAAMIDHVAFPPQRHKADPDAPVAEPEHGEANPPPVVRCAHPDGWNGMTEDGEAHCLICGAFMPDEDDKPFDALDYDVAESALDEQDGEHPNDDNSVRKQEHERLFDDDEREFAESEERARVYELDPPDRDDRDNGP